MDRRLIIIAAIILLVLWLAMEASWSASTGLPMG